VRDRLVEHGRDEDLGARLLRGLIQRAANKQRRERGIAATLASLGLFSGCQSASRRSKKDR
jgi:hypothetical protein